MALAKRKEECILLLECTSLFCRYKPKNEEKLLKDEVLDSNPKSNDIVTPTLEMVRELFEAGDAKNYALSHDEDIKSFVISENSSITREREEEFNTLLDLLRAEAYDQICGKVAGHAQKTLLSDLKWSTTYH